MATISQTALLPYAADLMFALVNDIESYPQFMHGCLAAEVIEASPELVIARLELGKAGLRYALTTRNLLQKPTRMDMMLVDGPFKKFTACWRFVPLAPAACKTCLDMDFEFRAGLIDKALSTLFEATGKDLVSAVSRRADHLYGKK